MARARHLSLWRVGGACVVRPCCNKERRSPQRLAPPLRLHTRHPCRPAPAPYLATPVATPAPFAATHATTSTKSSAKLPTTAVHSCTATWLTPGTVLAVAGLAPPQHRRAWCMRCRRSTAGTAAVESCDNPWPRGRCQKVAACSPQIGIGRCRRQRLLAVTHFAFPPSRFSVA